MIENLPSYISLLFGLTTLTTLLLFYWTIRKSTFETTRKKANTILLYLVIWLAVQAVLTLENFYNSGTNYIPPRIFVFGIFPTIIIILLFIRQNGRQFIDSLPLKNITYLNVVRIPVEITLLLLSYNKAVPQLMTFEGRNFDIIAGITAPFIGYYSLTNRKLSRQAILTWNFACLILLLNIVLNALLSAPSSLQKFAFDQPNIAILNFPFSWLPLFIVPVILFGHLTSIRQLIQRNKNNRQQSTLHYNSLTESGQQQYF